MALALDYIDYTNHILMGPTKAPWFYGYVLSKALSSFQRYQGWTN
jgi:hypothetical protein